MKLQSSVIRIYLCILIEAAGIAVASAAEKSTNFSGTWSLDPTKTEENQTSPEFRKLSITMGNNTPSTPEDKQTQTSPQNPLPGLSEAATLQILQTENEIQTIRQFPSNGQARTVIQKFKFDGSQCLNVASNGLGEFVSRSNWKNNKLIHSGSQTIFQHEQQVESYLKEEYSLSKNGRELMIKTTATGLDGVTTIKQVYIRRDK